MKIKLLLLSLLLIAFCGFSSAQTEITYQEVKLTGIGSISIPSILEVQSGTYKELSDRGLKDLGFDASGNIIFQQSGRNNSLKSSDTYARLIIKETVGKVGDYHSINSKLALSAKELNILDKASKAEFVHRFQTAGIKMKLLKWEGVTIAKISGFDALKTTYIRQLDDNPPVYVELYNIENYDREYFFTISYRLTDSQIWEDVLNKSKNSFKITNIRQPKPVRRKTRRN